MQLAVLDGGAASDVGNELQVWIEANEGWGGGRRLRRRMILYYDFEFAIAPELRMLQVPVAHRSGDRQRARNPGARW